MRSIDELVRKNIKNLKPFSSAREEYSGRADVFLDANENPFESAHNRYPDPYQKALKKCISEWKSVPECNIFLGNGSDEIIDLLIRSFCEPQRDIVRYIEPSFGMYEVSADINDVFKEAIPLSTAFDLEVDIVLAGLTDQHKILFLCTPNNPSGNELSRESIFSILASWKGLVVIDEAYHDFTNSKSYIDSLDEYPNLVVLQTFSKAMGAAGIRLGLCFASPDILRYLNKVKAPYNISSETQKIAINILADTQTYETQKNQLIINRDLLLKQLVGVSCIKEVFPSRANFLLLRVGDADHLKKYLLAKGIVVRDRSQLLHCHNCLRITIGTAHENERFLEVLKDYKKD